MQRQSKMLHQHSQIWTASHLWVLFFIICTSILPNSCIGACQTRIFNMNLVLTCTKFHRHTITPLLIVRTQTYLCAPTPAFSPRSRMQLKNAVVLLFYLRATHFFELACHGLLLLHSLSNRTHIHKIQTRKTRSETSIDTERAWPSFAAPVSRTCCPS